MTLDLSDPKLANVYLLIRNTLTAVGLF